MLQKVIAKSRNFQGNVGKGRMNEIECALRNGEARKNAHQSPPRNIFTGEECGERGDAGTGAHRVE